MRFFVIQSRLKIITFFSIAFHSFSMINAHESTIANLIDDAESLVININKKYTVAFALMKSWNNNLTAHEVALHELITTNNRNFFTRLLKKLTNFHYVKYAKKITDNIDTLTTLNELLDNALKTSPHETITSAQQQIIINFKQCIENMIALKNLILSLPRYKQDKKNYNNMFTQHHYENFHHTSWDHKPAIMLNEKPIIINNVVQNTLQPTPPMPNSPQMPNPITHAISQQVFSIPDEEYQFTYIFHGYGA